MNAPDRSGAVRDIFDRLSLPRAEKTSADDGRRANLFVIVKELNKLDGGQWGVLVKTDQANKIPGDVIVWKPTMEHFDVILGSGGPAWTVHGQLTHAPWHWQAVDDGGSGTGTEPEPPPATGGGSLDAALNSFMQDVRAKLGAIHVDVQASGAAIAALAEQKPSEPTAVTFPDYKTQVPFIGTVTSSPDV